MVTWIITLLIKWLSSNGYHVLKEDEYVLFCGRIDKMDERLDALTENVKARDANDVTLKDMVSEWLYGEAAT